MLSQHYVRTARVEKRKIALRVAAVAAGYFLSTQALDDWLLPHTHVPHGGFLHLAMQGALIGLAIIAGWTTVVRPLQRAALNEQLLGALRRGLEMADTSGEALAVFGRALEAFGDGRSAQLLLADASNARLTEALVVRAEHGSTCPVDSPMACPAVKRGQTLVFASASAIDSCPKLAGRAGGPCSAVCVPVSISGRTNGIFHVSSREGDVPDGEKIVTLRAMAGAISARLGMILSVAQSDLQATTDPLTGLLNRRKLADRALELSTLGVPFALAILDLDHLKQINDTYGHQMGDRVLRLVARTLEEVVGEQGFAGRYGGDEFVAVFPRCSLDEAAEITERLRVSVREAAATAGLPAMTCSAGIADGTSGSDLDEVLAAADRALLRAKEAGRDRLDGQSPQLTVARG